MSDPITLERVFLNWANRIGDEFQLAPPKTDAEHRIVWDRYLIPALCDEIYVYLAHYEELS